MGQFVRPLAKLNKEWGELTSRIGMQATQDPENVGAAAVDYMYYSGYVTLAYLWARMATVAQQHINNGFRRCVFTKPKLKNRSVLTLRNCCHAPKFMLLASTQALKC